MLAQRGGGIGQGLSSMVSSDPPNHQPALGVTGELGMESHGLSGCWSRAGGLHCTLHVQPVDLNSAKGGGGGGGRDSRLDSQWELKLMAHASNTQRPSPSLRPRPESRQSAAMERLPMGWPSPPQKQRLASAQGTEARTPYQNRPTKNLNSPSRGGDGPVGLREGAREQVAQ